MRGRNVQAARALNNVLYGQRHLVEMAEPGFSGRKNGYRMADDGIVEN
jgi:hypothetical protein